MAPRIAWLLNLDAEHELQQGSRYRRDPAVDARIAALIPRMSSLVAAQDFVVGRDDDLHEASLALAFCPTPSALQRLRERGLAPAITTPTPLLRTLARRGFSASLGRTLDGETYVENLEQLAAVLANAPAASRAGLWVLKRDFSFAGRGQLRVRDLDDAGVRGFAQHSFARGEGLQVEPWCERVLDVAQHGFLRSDGALSVGPPRVQLCDARGVWQESRDAHDELLPGERDALADAVAQAGAALRERAFCGPFGIDGFRYLGPEGEAFRARCELNTRFTMGYPRALVVSALCDAGVPLTLRNQ